MPMLSVHSNASSPTRNGSCAGRDDAFGERHGGVLVVHALGHDDELVAAEAGERVGGPEMMREPFGHLRQHRVADAVAERVVDDLEPVEVEVQHRQHAPRRSRRRNAWCNRSISTMRLATPVSGSLRAWRCSTNSCSWRAVMSRIVDTTRADPSAGTRVEVVSVQQYDPSRQRNQ